MKRAFAELVEEGAVAIIGPSISDNALIAAPLCDEARIPAINYSGGERTRSQWMFHYQVGSLEEEPPVLAQRMVERGLGRAAVVFDQSPVGRRYAECFEAARARLGLEVTGTASISSLAESADDLLARLRGGNPDVLVYLGLGVSSRAVAFGARLARLGHPGARQLRADVRLRAPRLARRLRGLGVRRHDRRRQRAPRVACASRHRAPAADRSAAPRTTSDAWSVKVLRSQIT